MSITAGATWLPDIARLHVSESTTLTWVHVIARPLAILIWHYWLEFDKENLRWVHLLHTYICLCIYIYIYIYFHSQNHALCSITLVLTWWQSNSIALWVKQPTNLNCITISFNHVFYGCWFHEKGIKTIFPFHPFDSCWIPAHEHRWFCGFHKWPHSLIGRYFWILVKKLDII